MNEEEYRKYLSLIQSMCLDAQMGGITQATFIQNLAMIAKNMAEAVTE